LAFNISALSRLGKNLPIVDRFDGASNILKEFWPDIKAILFGPGKASGPAANKNP